VKAEDIISHRNKHLIAVDKRGVEMCGFPMEKTAICITNNK